MELSQIVQLIAIMGGVVGVCMTVVGVGVKIERRLTKIESKLDRCPHVENKSPLVHPAADF